MSSAVSPFPRTHAEWRTLASESVLEPAAVFVGLATLFTVLRSHNLTAVDGAVRAFAVFHNSAPQFHGSSHMLYPIYILWWTRAAQSLGFSMADPFSFIGVAQAMNAFFAAACAAFLLTVLRSLGVSRWVALSASIGWAFSRAVSLHATNSAEPMAGLFWSVAAFACVVYACRSSKVWLIPPAGVLLAIAMATYQSMVLIAIACGLMMLLWKWRGEWQLGAALKAALLLTVPFFAGLIVVYGTSYYVQHIPNLSAAMHLFLNSPDREVWGGFTLAKAANIPTGLALSLFPCLPHDFGGLRVLVLHHGYPLAVLALTLAAVLGGYLGLVRRFIQMSSHSWDERLAVVVSSYAAIITTFVLMCYWNPFYDKTWLQPLWLLFLAAAIFADRIRFRYRTITHLAAALVGAIIVVNVSIAVRDSRGPWPDVEEATRVKGFVGSHDLVVTDWNAVSTIYHTMWAPDRTWDFVSESGVYHSATPDVLQTKIDETQRAGASVYFLGLLDLDRNAWTPVLTAKCGIPYEALDHYRNRSTLIASFRSRERLITLRKFAVEP